MTTRSDRFIRLPAQGHATKLAARSKVNADLSISQAFNDALFRRQLEAKLGPADPGYEPDEFFMTFKDTETNLVFGAHNSPASGPGYRGEIDSYRSLSGGGLALKFEVQDALKAFEAWITAGGD